MPEMDRSKRYANPPKAKHGKMQNKDEVKAESTVEKAAKDPKDSPTDAKPGPVGKVGEDPGPEGSPSPEFGVIAERHKSETSSTMKRHAEEGAAMHERHGKEVKDMMSRHHKEMQDHMESKAEGKAAATAGSPKELGTPKKEGKDDKGSNV